MGPIQRNDKEKLLLHHKIKWILVSAQIFGLFPVRGITCHNYKNLVFSWYSKRALFAAAIILGSLFITIMSFCRMHEVLTFHRLGSFFFNLNGAVSGILFFKLAKSWPKLIKKWSKVEMSLGPSPNPKNSKNKFYFIASAIMTAATVEHILSDRHIYQLSGENSNKVKAYFLMNYPHLFDYIEFSIPLAIFGMIMNICNVFSWNYLDAFLMIISVALAEHFHEINERVEFAFKKKIQFKHHWMKLREDYNNVSVLCKIVNKEISNLILVSFSTNMYHIMAQLYSCLNEHKGTPIEAAYFSFSFALLLLRTVAVTLLASSVNDESKKSMSYLLSLHSDCYNSEIERFVYQIHCQPIALTGNDFFTITRGLLFNMVGAIVTYELFMIQSNIVPRY